MRATPWRPRMTRDLDHARGDQPEVAAPARAAGTGRRPRPVERVPVGRRDGRGRGGGRPVQAALQALGEALVDRGSRAGGRRSRRSCPRPRPRPRSARTPSGCCDSSRSTCSTLRAVDSPRLGSRLSAASSITAIFDHSPQTSSLGFYSRRAAVPLRAAFALQKCAARLFRARAGSTFDWLSPGSGRSGGVPNPWLAIDASTAPPRARARGAVAPGSSSSRTASLAAVRAPVADSWQRSQAAGVDPSGSRLAPVLAGYR